MAETVINYRLDLLLRLIDTTSGKTIREKNVQFSENGSILHLIDKGEAGYVLLNHGRDDFSLKVSVYGYESITIPVVYDRLDRTAPTMETYLIPLDTQKPGDNIISIQGVLPGIESIEAVSKGPVYWGVKEYDERRRSLTITNPHKLSLCDVHYGILNHDMDSYEHIVAEKVTDSKMKIDRTIAFDDTQNYSLARIIFGRTEPDGRYLLRVRAQEANPRFLIRYQVEGKVKFCSIDCMDTQRKELE